MNKLLAVFLIIFMGLVLAVPLANITAFAIQKDITVKTATIAVCAKTPEGFTECKDTLFYKCGETIAKAESPTFSCNGKAFTSDSTNLKSAVFDGEWKDPRPVEWLEEWEIN